jgi:hypothetical protein
MFKHYINLELKAFFRSLVWEKHWLKNLMGFSSLFFTCFFSCGIALYPMLSETFGSKPLAINSYVIFWLAIELIFVFYAKFTGDEY